MTQNTSKSAQEFIHFGSFLIINLVSLFFPVITFLGPHFFKLYHYKTVRIAALIFIFVSSINLTKGSKDFHQYFAESMHYELSTYKQGFIV